MRTPGNRRSRGRPTHPDVLTPAEWRVLDELRAGRTNAEIAARLGISVNTVRSHVSTMLSKLQLTHRHKLAAWDGKPDEVSRRGHSRFTLIAPFAWFRDTFVGSGLATGAAFSGMAIAVVSMVLLLNATFRNAGIPSGATPGPPSPTASVPTEERPEGAMSVTFDFGAEDAVLDDFGSLHAYMGTTECGRVDFLTGERTLVIGGAGAPAACNQAWRVVNFVLGDGSALANDPIFQPDTTITLDTFTPFAAVDGPDVSSFFIWIQPQNDSQRADLADRGALTAYVSGTECGTASLSRDSGDAPSVPVGAPGTPDECRQVGDEITLVDEAGRALAVRPTVLASGYYILTDFTSE